MILASLLHFTLVNTPCTLEGFYYLRINLKVISMEARNPTGERVLVVDDDPTLCRMLGQVLRAEGYQTQVCTDPRDALIMFAQETFELALIDLNLPQMSGLELASTLKHQNPLLEVAFITGYGTFDDAVQAIRIGAYDFLRKPVSINELSLCLKRLQERQALSEKARLADQRYFHLVDNLPILVLVIQRDFHVDFVNQACEAMLGYTPEEAKDTPNWFLERIHPEARQRLRELFDLAFNYGGSPFSIECRLVHRKGHLIHGIVKSISSSRSETSHPVERLESIVVDVTDRIFLDKAVMQKEKLKTLGIISAEVAHEIRNPLVAIGGFARRLQKEFPDLSACEIILRETRRLEKMLDKIRNYLKPEEINHQPCSINALIGDSLDLLSPEMGQRRVTYQLDLEPQLPFIYGDSDILTQVFINLIRNAMEAMDERGTLTIKTYESDQNLHIDFRNPVCGPLVEDPEVLFLTLDEGGQSIGLPLCYRLVKNLDGMLSFAQEDNCAVFTISLPKTVQQKTDYTPAPCEILPGEASRAEKRRYPRTKVWWPATLRTTVKSVEGTIRNICLGGAFISCETPLALNETFQVIIETTRQKSFSASSQVVWSNSSGLDKKDAPAEIGARFIEISRQERQLLQEMISAH
jgi:PAS domain S-box-containing protein